MLRHVLEAILVALLVSACDAAPNPEPFEAAFVPGERPPLHVFNNTTIPVAVAVNGRFLRNVGPSDGSDIDVDRLPPVPWLVEARTLSGRLLVSITVHPGDVLQHMNPDGSVDEHDIQGKVDLSCGRLVLFAGELRPGAAGGAPPPQPAGVPGDCA